MMRGIVSNPRLAFLCGCAEPGKDGVGDYTRLLAGACGGCPALVIALNDPHVSGSKRDAETLRLGPDLSWEARVEAARGAVEQFGAETISLQWVPYAFHPRGVPWGIGPRLARIAGNRAVHLMCHEIWIGAETGASLAHRITGAAQRAALRRMWRALKPVRVHTSNETYAALLQRAGIAAEVLPLFGSIPVTGEVVEKDGGVLRFGMFGTIHPVWPPEALMEKLRSLGRPVEVAHIGRMGDAGEVIWSGMEKRYGDGIQFTRHGEQPAGSSVPVFDGAGFRHRDDAARVDRQKRHRSRDAGTWAASHRESR